MSMPPPINPMRSHGTFRKKGVAELGNQFARRRLCAENRQLNFYDAHKRIFHLPFNSQPHIPNRDHSIFRIGFEINRAIAAPQISEQLPQIYLSPFRATPDFESRSFAEILCNTDNQRLADFVFSEHLLQELCES